MEIDMKVSSFNFQQTFKCAEKKQMEISMNPGDKNVSKMKLQMYSIIDIIKNDKT